MTTQDNRKLAEDAKGFIFDNRGLNQLGVKKTKYLRELVPDLATALLAALGRVEELERDAQDLIKTVNDLAWNATQFSNELDQLKAKVPADVDCPFCHHPSHADKACGECSCKTGVIKNAN